MTKNDTLLLYKDLSGRTTYGTKIKHDNGIFTFDNSHCGIGMIDVETSPKIILSGCYYGDNIKPYLFPLSSMTAEQKTTYNFLSKSGHANPIALLDFYNKNNLDYRSLIPKGLAIDATRLNIY
jgi:hypothetical protein